MVKPATVIVTHSNSNFTIGKLTRWIFFLPLGVFILCIPELVVITMARNWPGWVSLPTAIFFNVLAAMAAVFAVRICPHRIIGAIVLGAIFCFLAIPNNFSRFHSSSWPEIICRILVDGALIMGLIVGATKDSGTPS